MSGKAIHQFTSFAKRGDAVYDHAEQLRKVFLSWGCGSNIYVLDPDSAQYDGVAYYKRYKPKPDDILLYHFGIGSVLTNFLISQPGKKFLVYHNMTPEEYLLGVDNQTYLHIRKGRKELDRLKSEVEGVFAASEYSANDLKKDHGYENIMILPILKDFSAYEGKKLNPDSVKKWKSDKKTIFFIGRITSHKRQDELIKTLYAYTRLYGHDVRLVMPGSWKNSETYKDYLIGLVDKLGLNDSVEIPGFIDDDDFHTLFKTADVYLSLSEHEGFGVPILEAMWFGVPVIASGVCSIPELMGEAGIKLNGKNSVITATVLRELFENGGMKQKIIERQKERLKNFSVLAISEVLQRGLGPYLKNT